MRDWELVNGGDDARRIIVRNISIAAYWIAAAGFFLALITLAIIGLNSLSGA